MTETRDSQGGMFFCSTLSNILWTCCAGSLLTHHLRRLWQVNDRIFWGLLKFRRILWYTRARQWQESMNSPRVLHVDREMSQYHHKTCATSTKYSLYEMHMTAFAVMALHLLEQVLSSSSHPHLFDDLLVQTGSCVLQFAASSLGKRVATLLKKKDGRSNCQYRTLFHVVQIPM